MPAPRTSLLTALAWGAGLGVAAGVGVGLVAGVLVGNLTGWVVLTGSTALAAGLTIAFILWAVTGHPPREPCPHCGYDTHGLPRDAGTGQATCPECGKAVPNCRAQEAAGSGLP
ncbi:MAG: hypothetical protein RIB58_14410 [Phycisphaerales bacterium]